MSNNLSTSLSNEEINQLKNAMRNNIKINIISYSLTEQTEKFIDFIVIEILKKYKREDLKSSIYTCIKELAVNGTKANLKSVFFQRRNIHFQNEKEIKKGTELFKRILEKSREKGFGKIVFEKGYYVKISFEYSDNGLNVYVYNNCIIPEYDRKRIITKLEKSRYYESIADYYMDAFDDTEGLEWHSYGKYYP
jgi:hypothetical protein